MGGLDEFNSEEFEPEVPEFKFGEEPSVRACNRILPKSLQSLISTAALAAHWGQEEIAARARMRAGYV